MELRDFAEAILFARDIDGKLLAPASMEDERPGSVMAVPEFPRHQDVEGSEFLLPRRHQLDRDATRGRLLLRLADHELLALELMALALLRFPEAPGSFRRDLFATMRDEQRHLKLYLDRAGQLGVGPEEIPATRRFWDQLADVDSPLAFVSGMALGLEQANLDFATEWAATLRSIGDSESADVLEQVLRDEIRHVRSGWRWFREWTDVGADPWEAFVASLPPRVLPRHARGTRLHRAPRRAAGLDESFIDRLATTGGSRGRPGRLVVFNPGCEESLVTGESVPSKAARQTAIDLSLMLVALTREEDCLLVPEPPDPSRLARLCAAGFTLPELAVSGIPVGEAPDAVLARRRFGGLRPWGHVPELDRRLAPLRSRLSTGAGAPELSSCPASMDTFYRKSRGQELARAHALEGSESSWTVRDLDAWAATMGRASLEGRRRVVLKADLGASGRGQRRTQAWPPDDGDERFAASILRRQGALIIEAWHERVLDLSLHFTVLGPEQVRFDGATRFVVDERGQYEGSVLGPWRQGLSADVQRALATECPDLDARFQILVQLIGKDLAGRGFLGPASLDSYLYRGPEDGSLHWRALVEINPRWTMGRLALALGRRHLSRRSRGELRVFSGGSVHEEGQRLEAAYPLVMEPQQDRPRIASGALVLSQTTPRTRLAAVLLAGAALEDTRS